jgi:hypothetical protein
VGLTGRAAALAAASDGSGTVAGVSAAFAFGAAAGVGSVTVLEVGAAADSLVATTGCCVTVGMRRAIITAATATAVAAVAASPRKVGRA